MKKCKFKSKNGNCMVYYIKPTVAGIWVYRKDTESGKDDCNFKQSICACLILDYRRAIWMPKK